MNFSLKLCLRSIHFNEKIRQIKYLFKEYKKSKNKLPNCLTYKNVKTYTKSLLLEEHLKLSK